MAECRLLTSHRSSIKRRHISLCVAMNRVQLRAAGPRGQVGLKCFQHFIGAPRGFVRDFRGGPPFSVIQKGILILGCFQKIVSVVNCGMLNYGTFATFNLARTDPFPSDLDDHMTSLGA